MEDNQPSAQADNTVNENQTQPETPPQANEGIQKRFDQLTANLHEERRAREELTKQLLEMSLKQQAAPPPPPPQPEADPLAQYADKIDPTVKDAVSAAVAATQRRMEQQFASMQQQYQQQMAQLQLHNVAASKPVAIPPEVKASAEQLLRQYPGTPPDVALELAYGRHAIAEAARVKGVQNYSPPSQPTFAAPPPASRSNFKAPPANFDSLSPEAQLAWYEQNGFDDSPL